MISICPKMNLIIHKDKTKMDLAAYHHGSFFSQVESTFVSTIKNNHFTLWPGLNPQLIVKNLPPILPMAKGNLTKKC